MSVFCFYLFYCISIYLTISDVNVKKKKTNKMEKWKNGNLKTKKKYEKKG